MSDLTILIATNKDAEIIADLSRETFYNAFASSNTKENIDKFMNEVFTREKLMKELDLPDNIFLLAYNNNKVVGYVRLRDNNLPEINLSTRNVIELARIYTVSTETDKGIGGLLLNACIKIAKEKERKYLWLGVWEHNHKAIRFYKRFGFTKFGEHDFVLGNDIQTDWLMKREIS